MNELADVPFWLTAVTYLPVDVVVRRTQAATLKLWFVCRTGPAVSAMPVVPSSATARSAPPVRPLVHDVPPASVAELPLPDASFSVVPLPSSICHWPAGPIGPPARK